MDLYVFEANYASLGILSSPTSVSYTERYQSLGSFEIQLPLDETNVELIKKERIIMLDNTRKIAGLIGIIQKEKLLNNTNKLVVKGNLIEEYLYWRICWGLYTKSGIASEVIKDLVATQIASPIIADRAISDMTIPQATAIGASIAFQSTGGVVGTNIEQLCASNNLGFRVKFLPTPKQMEFYCYRGTDRTIQQKQFPPCIFSSKYENILSSEYSLNIQDARNVGLVAGEGEGINRKTVTVGTGVGKSRREVFIDARDLQSTNMEGMSLRVSEYDEMLKQRGLGKLSTMREVESFDCTVNVIGNVRYNEDYFLGDIVTIFDQEIGVQLNATITEVQRIIDDREESLFVTFGIGPMTLAQKLKSKVV